MTTFIFLIMSPLKPHVRYIQKSYLPLAPSAYLIFFALVPTVEKWLSLRLSGFYEMKFYQNAYKMKTESERILMVFLIIFWYLLYFSEEISTGLSNNSSAGDCLC